MGVKTIFIEREIANQQLTIFLSETQDRFSVVIQQPSKNSVNIDADYIKCGISGQVPHPNFIRKVVQFARDKLAVYFYPPEGPPTEVWIFEAAKTVAPIIQKAKEYLKKDHPEEAIRQLETALKIQQHQRGDTGELNSVILQLKKNQFLCKIQQDAPLYLSPEGIININAVIDLYRDEKDLFSCLHEYNQAVEIIYPHLHFLAALIHEHQGNSASAVPHYLYLGDVFKILFLM